MYSSNILVGLLQLKKLIIILSKVDATTSKLKGFLFYYMEEKTISNETLERVKTLPRFDYVAYQMLVTSKQVESYVKFKKPRTIFFDEEICRFLYLNPYHKELHICGKFIEESEVLNG